MKKNYYYFVTGLPSIGLDDNKLPISPTDFLAYAKLFLTEEDFSYLKTLVFPFDLENLIALLCQKDEYWNEIGFYSKDDWILVIDYCQKKTEDQTVIKAVKSLQLPNFIFTFLNHEFEQETPSTKYEIEKSLFSAFYQHVSEHSNEFIRNWFRYDQDMKNILIALNCKRHNLSVQDRFIGSNELTEKLSKIHHGEIVIGKEFPLFEELLRIFDNSDIIEREKGFDQLKWKWIDQTNFFQYFTIDRILGYFCKLLSLNRWLSMEQHAGETKFNQILNKLETSFEFPEEFALNRR